MTKVFRFWCQKVLPLVYDDSLSYYEILCKVVDYLNNVVKDTNAISEIVGSNTTNISELQTELNVVNKELEAVKNGDYVSLYLNSIIQWIDNNLADIIGRAVKFVSFGLTDDGYFVAYIPDNWNELKFDTIMDYDNTYYGHLVLNY